MGIDSIDSDLARIKQQGDEYAKLATFVSGQIGTIEQQLNSSSGKIPYSCVEDGIALSFARSPTGWILWVIDPCDVSSIEEVNDNLAELWSPLSASSVLTKARALKVFPKMLQAMVSLQKEHLSALRQTVGELHRVTPNNGGK